MDPSIRRYRAWFCKIDLAIQTKPLSFLWSLTLRAAFPIIHSLVGAWLSLVERSVRDREVGGSNPLAPTTYFRLLRTAPAVRFQLLLGGSMAVLFSDCESDPPSYFPLAGSVREPLSNFAPYLPASRSGRQG